MKKALSLFITGALFVIVIFSSACNKQYLRGHFTVEEFLDSAQWKVKVDEKYEPKAKWMDSLSTIEEAADVRIYLGTYCPDSKKWIPRFLKLRPSIPVGEVDIISVDTTKKDAEGLAMQEKVEKVPTFIFYRSGSEVGRIVEKPKGRLEKALYNTLKNK